MEKSDFTRRHIHQEVTKELVNARLDCDHPMGAVLEGEAQIVGLLGRPCVRIVDANGNWVMLADRIEELKADPRFRDSIPNPTRVAKSDLDGVRDHFNDIVSGAAVVE